MAHAPDRRRGAPSHHDSKRQWRRGAVAGSKPDVSREPLRDLDAISAAVRQVFDDFVRTEIHPLRKDVQHLHEHVRGNGRPGLVQQVAIVEERQRTLRRSLRSSTAAIDRLQQRIHMLLAGVVLSTLAAVLSYLLR